MTSTVAGTTGADLCGESSRRAVGKGPLSGYPDIPRVSHSVRVIHVEVATVERLVITASVTEQNIGRGDSVHGEVSNGGLLYTVKPQFELVNGCRGQGPGNS